MSADDAQAQEAAARAVADEAHGSGAAPTTAAGEESFADAEAPPAPPEPQPASAAQDGEAPPAGGVAEPEGEAEPGGAEPDYLLMAQRIQADFDNFRRRASREQGLAGERGVGRVAKELLPALDHLELAIQAVEQDEAHAGIAKGFRLVQDELGKALGRVGVEAFSPEGEAFDPNQHEAMTQQPFEGVESGTVAQVYQRGYRLNGTVLRPARVVVAA